MLGALGVTVSKAISMACCTCPEQHSQLKESTLTVWVDAGMGEDGRSRGFAHVQFETVEAAAAAIGMSGQEFSGRELFIDSARERAAGGRAGAGGASSASLACPFGLKTAI